MPTYQVITSGKDHEHEIYKIRADKFHSAQGNYTFHSGEEIVAWFAASHVIGVIDKDSQERE
jgi:hypothetical protein